jgi:thiol-disulfide isomerase/thioredoxin
MRITRLVIGFGLLALVLSGCATRQAADVPAESELETDFELVLYQGADVLGDERIKFSEVLAQGKPVVLIMWASSCPSCRIDMGLLEAAGADYAGEVLIVGLHIGHFVGMGSEESARAFLSDEGITFPNGATPDINVIRDYEVLNTPSIYFVKPSGEIIQRVYGLVGDADLRGHIDELVAASDG